MANREYLRRSQREELLATAVIPLNFITASGQPARQKFDFDRVKDDSNLFPTIVAGLAACIRASFTDYNGILTVAHGATRLGEPLGAQLEVPHIKSDYTIADGVKQFTVAAEDEVSRVLIIDDVYNRGTNTTKTALAAQEQGIETVGVAVVLNRSPQFEQHILRHIAVASLVHEPLE